MEKKKVYRVQRYLLIHILKIHGQFIFSKKSKEVKWVYYGEPMYVIAKNATEAEAQYMLKHPKITKLNDERKECIRMYSLYFDEEIDEENLKCEEVVLAEPDNSKSYEFLRQNLKFEDFVELLHQELFQTTEN